jgi:hypothetical protein
MDPHASQEISSKAVSTLEEQRPAAAFHVCLAGSSVSNNWALIESLKRHYQVTVIETFDLLLRNSVLSTVDVLLLDCEEGGEVGIETLRTLKRRHCIGEWGPDAERDRYCFSRRCAGLFLAPFQRAVAGGTRSLFVFPEP